MNLNKNLASLKIKIITILIFFLCFSLNTLAKSGSYIRETEAINSTKLKWTLLLNSEGTFLYHFYRNIEGEGNPEENYYGNGTWELKGKQIYFYSTTSTSNPEFSVNLNNSKARYITKPSRDKSDKVIKTSLRFYESETFHIKGLILFKE